MKAKDIILTSVLVVACSTLSAIGGAAITKHGSDSSEAYETTEPAKSSRAYMASTPPNFVEVAERTIDGVVNIRTEKAVRMAQERFFDPFEFFFGIPSQRDPRQEGRSRQETPKQVEIGSGVIISRDGYIVTNNHVIDGADDVYVTTNSNEEYKAKVVGTDPSTDLALIKIESGKELTAIPFGNSDDLRVGEWVLAIGNPFNLRSTVTAGIVSAKGRAAGSGQGSLQVGSFIQSDVAVNPGNSGGALVNMAGELIGINTMIYSSTGNYAGISFAIPTSIVHKVVGDLKEYGTVQRAVLGIAGTNITSAATEKYDLKVSQGALVMEVADRSSAKQAGLTEGDVITSIDGHSISTMSDLQEAISTHKPGDKVRMSVDRKGKTMTIDLVLKNSEGNTDAVTRIDESSIGAAFLELSDKEMSDLGISYGVKVVGVDRDGKFFRAGIRKGDVILAVNNLRVSKKDDVEKVVSDVVKSSSDKVLFVKLLNTNGRINYVAVDLRD
ncbi:Do family serine endopeptidase [uncultured Porphyromonas sp.]|uniref:Do family serine endopeptidase n=1 Tax=uncultured Porphyromonas sp. TaxID=159274 RepID=UPI002635BEC3|nr:Do family serine endopeptidase [uncultured Porphyromonas sp.]